MGTYTGNQNEPRITPITQINLRNWRNSRLIFLACVCLAWAARAAQAAPPTPVREFVTAYCVTCHSDRLKTGGLSLERDDAAAETWEKVVVKLRSRSMPPPGNRRPDNATYDTMAGLLERELDQAAATHLNPG